jgi:hypothetical protein
MKRPRSALSPAGGGHGALDWPKTPEGWISGKWRISGQVAAAALNYSPPRSHLRAANAMIEAKIVQASTGVGGVTRRRDQTA